MAGIVAAPFVLLAVVATLLYVPPVQQWAVRQACNYARENTGWDVDIESVRLRWVADLDLQGLRVESTDLALSARHVVVDLDFSNILKGQLGVESIDIEEADVDTRTMVATMQVKGGFRNFHLDADNINLKDQEAHLGKALLEGADVDIAMRDTTVVDTTESEPLMWVLNLDDVQLTDSRVAFHMPGDSMCVGANLREVHLQRGRLDLGNECYSLDSICASADSISYDMTYEPATEGLDPNHIRLADVGLGVDSLRYCGGALDLTLRELKGNEQCGLQICGAQAQVHFDDDEISIANLQLATLGSEAEGSVSLPWKALEEGGGGRLNAHLRARVASQEVALAVPAVSDYLPAGPSTLLADVTGNVDTLRLDTLTLMVEPMAWADARGEVRNVLSTARLAADVDWSLRTYDMSQVVHLADMDTTLRIPQLTAQGDAHVQGQHYYLTAQVREGDGRLSAKASYGGDDESYSVQAALDNLNLHHFLYRDSLYRVDGRINLTGKGTDFQSRATRMQGYVRVDTLVYGHLNLGDMTASVNMQRGHADVDVTANNAILVAQACVEADLERDVSLANFSLALSRADLYALGVMDKPFDVRMQLTAEGSSDFKNNHQLEASVRALELALTDTIVRPQDMDVRLLITPDTTFAWAQAGDLHLDLQSPESVETLTSCATVLGKEIEKQYEERNFNQPLLRSLLPLAKVTLSSGTGNPVSEIIKQATGMSFGSLNLDLQIDSVRGLNGDGQLMALNTGALQIDTISMRIHQDSAGVVGALLHVANNKKNKQVVFRGDVEASLAPSSVGMEITIHDADNRKGVDLGAQLALEQEGMRLRLFPLNPVLAYRGFTLNEDNFVYLGNDQRLEADVDLLADDGTGFKLYTSPNDEALQDITLSMHNVNVGELTSVFPYMPSVQGMLAGDVHLVQDEQSMSVSVDAQVDSLVYEGAALGDIGLNATYLPNSDGSHFIDGILLHEGNEVALISGTYDPSGEGSIDAEAVLQQLPLSLANGFIPDGMATLAGTADAQLTIQGPLSQPILNGMLCTDSLMVHSDAYSLDLSIPNDTLVFENSLLNLNRIEVYSKGKQPLVLDGTVDMRELSDVELNLSLQATNFELINASKTRNSVVYGKVFVDLMGNLTGKLSDMQLRGRLAVLGNTDVTYVLTDSPLTVEDQLADLVTFVDFNEVEDSVEIPVAQPQNIDMRMLISIEQAAQVHVLLSQDGSNYINLEGGGDLTMTYTSLNGLQLQGRYTIVSGELNYSLMVMSLRDCEIKQGSYVEFTGDPMNPKLSLTATERVKTTVYEDNTPRSVTFEVGVEISQTLLDMGMTFTIDAPDDLTISNQLAAMTVEGRGKVAVTMLATGMYLTDESSTSGFSGSNALNSFLQTQISAISGKAFSTLDINFGVDNTTTSSGASQTDYNFSFAKRFWGNRISLIIGGKVSSGSEAENSGQSIVDNISIEYRLDNSATRYVRVYYDRSTESLLEGEITEMGAGVVFRRKSTRLGELFIFRKDKKKKNDASSPEK